MRYAIGLGDGVWDGGDVGVLRLRAGECVLVLGVCVLRLRVVRSGSKTN
ncbi:hypothetical protein NST94_23415 [Paenibacillus sp. FSL H8-0282]|nr:hypothetical protein [Paenibacillus sp. PastF-4]MDH6447309.1 hypothetical protein [Paenibacillus sp. PastF-4]